MKIVLKEAGKFKEAAGRFTHFFCATSFFSSLFDRHK